MTLRVLFIFSLVSISTLQSHAATWTQEKLRNEINLVASHLEPIIKSQDLKFGNITIDWVSDLLQAGVRIDPEDDHKIEVKVHGGLVRFPNISDDAITLVLCHEFGHVLGGSPKQPRHTPKGNQIVYKDGTFESQADYFATLKCFRSIHNESANMVFLSDKNVPPNIIQKCSEVWPIKNDQYLCMRTLLAAENLINVMEQAKETFSTENYKAQTVSLQKKDESITNYVSGLHSSPQCRLDTFVEGALCKIPFAAGVSDTDPNVGVCVQGALGGRPACWFNAEIYSSAWRHVQLPTDSIWNGIGSIDGKCSGSLLEVGTDDSNAVVLTAGHCFNVMQKPAFFHLGSTLKSSDLLSVPIENVIFRTMGNVDMALLSLNQTKKNLKNLGFNFYRLGSYSGLNQVVNIGIPMRKVLGSSQRLIKATCKLKDKVKIQEDIFKWEALRTTCTNVDGLSGSPLFNPNSREIVGWLNTVIESDFPGNECGINRPCEVIGIRKESHPEFSYAQIAEKVMTCFSSSGNFDSKSCNRK